MQLLTKQTCAEELVCAQYVLGNKDTAGNKQAYSIDAATPPAWMDTSQKLQKNDPSS